jgi:polyisoprenoid-binding protein YceI
MKTLACAGAALILLSACGPESGSAPASGAGAATASPAAGASADLPKGEVTYYFGASDARTKITFESKTEIMNMVGETTKLKGSVTIDFDKGTGTCQLVVPTLSLKTGMDDRDRAMLGKMWLDARQFPTIEFKADKAAFTKPYAWNVDGTFSLHGVTRPLSLAAEIKPVPDSIAKGLGEGRWIRVKTSFKVKLEDYAIKIHESAVATVEPVWNVTVAIFGTTVKPTTELKVDDPLAAEETGPAVRAPKVSDEGLTGTKYRFGIKPQLTSLKADSVMEVENVTAASTNVAGFLGLDREKGAGQVRLATAVKALKTGIEDRDKHLQSETWLDAAQFPDIRFESTKASKKGDKTWAVEGNFTMHGVTKPVTLDVELTDIPAELVKKAHWGDKPGVRCVGQLKVKLSDYGVKIPDIAVAKVNDAWTISFSLVGLLAE